MDLLTNAIQAIQLGVEDYQSGSRARLLSAVRNIHAGVLLLYKEALRRQSPPNSEDVLIKTRIVPSHDASGNVIFVGKGKKTVDTHQIRERFESLGIATDWERFLRIAAARNDVEHYFPQLSKEALHGVIADAFLIIRAFVAKELQDDSLKLLGEKTWQTMLSVAEVYKAEKQDCQLALDNTKWTSETLKESLGEYVCDACGSDLLKPVPSDHGEIKLQCSLCGSVEGPDSYTAKAISAALDAANYASIKDGGSSLYVDCPECGEETYVVEENRCAYCGHEAELTCIRCGNEIPPEELDCSPLCGWCQHMSNKDD